MSSEVDCLFDGDVGRVKQQIPHFVRREILKEKACGFLGFLFHAESTLEVAFHIADNRLILFESL